MADSTITMDTDWGAPGSQLSGAQVQAFIKNELKKLQESNNDLTQTVSQFSSNINTASGRCLIAYHQNIDGRLRTVPHWLWPQLQDEGEVADGVMVFVDGRAPIVVSVTESILPWSQRSFASCSGEKTESEAYSDFDGKNNTSKIINAGSGLIDPSNTGNESKYAPFFCNQYSRLHDKGDETMIGFGKGKWWLPSIAELMVICKYYYEINQCLTLIKKAIPLRRALYVSSTEKSSNAIWGVSFNNATIGAVDKINSSYYVRPICMLKE